MEYGVISIGFWNAQQERSWFLVGNVIWEVCVIFRRWDHTVGIRELILQPRWDFINQVLFLFSFSFLIVDHNVISIAVCLFCHIGIYPLELQSEKTCLLSCLCQVLCCSIKKSNQYSAESGDNKTVHGNWHRSQPMGCLVRLSDGKQVVRQTLV